MWLVARWGLAVEGKKRQGAPRNNSHSSNNSRLQYFFIFKSNVAS